MTTGTQGASKLADASSILVATPDVRDAPVSACSGLISNSDVEPDRVVGVAVCPSATDWLDAWNRVVDGVAASVTVVDVVSASRSVAAESGDRRPAATVRTIHDASNLTALGDALRDELATASANGETVAVCVHSLTDLLGHADERSTFKFLATLGDLAREYDATAYAHADSRANDAETVEVFATACDTVVEFNDGAELTVR